MILTRFYDLNHESNELHSNCYFHDQFLRFSCELSRPRSSTYRLAKALHWIKP